MNHLVRRHAVNTVGRDFIVGDIHGNFTRLQAALNSIGFDSSVDRLFSVGDLVDRGPESEDAIEWLEKPWFFAVRGNHEEMAIDWASGLGDSRNYVANGGGWNVGNTPERRLVFADAFAALPVAIEIETGAGLVGVVHASCPFHDWCDFVGALSRNDLEALELEQLITMATWSRERILALDDSMVCGVRAVVVGHTPVQTPTSLGNTIFIDTAAWHPQGAGFTFLNASTLGLSMVPNSKIAEAT